MSISLDHIFVLTPPGACAADRLIEHGFVEGNANTHPGQGTTNRRFFLPRFTIEFLYISDADEAANGAGKALGLLERSLNANASPFGIVVRVPDKESTPSFPSRQYKPDFFGDGMCFYVGENSTLLNEPLCICMPPALPKRSEVPSEYANPGWDLSMVQIDVPVEKPSSVLQQFAAMDKLRVNYGKAHKMTLKFTLVMHKI